MKIKKINLISFGKFSGREIELGDKTVIFGKNEAGKSTVAAFIRLMLFGARRASGDRKRYIPWEGGAVEGEMTVERDGKEYLLRRSIGASAKSDKVSVLCSSTGEVTDRLPGLADEDVYERTAFMEQQSAAFDRGADLAAALREAAFGSDGARVDEALKELGDKRRLITNPRGKYKGELDMARERLNSLLLKRDAAEADRSLLPQLNEKLSRLTEEYNAAADKLAETGKKDYTEEISQKEKALSELDEQLAAAKESLSRATQREQKAKIAADVAPLSFAMKWICAALALAFAVIAAALLLSREFITAIAPLCFAVMFAAFIRLGINQCKRFKENGINSYREAKALINDTDAGEAERAENELTRLTNEYSELSAVISYLKTEERTDKNKAEAARKRLDGTADALWRVKAETERAAAANPNAYDADIAEAKREISEQEQRLCDINDAEEGIKSALRRLSEIWLPRMSNDISRRAAEIMGREVNIFADEGLNLTVYENGSHELDRYSGGTRDQLYLALRLSAAEALFPDDAPPLILDDPFAQYDEERQGRAIDILLKYADKNQIIIFTCKNPALFFEKGFNVLTI